MMEWNEKNSTLCCPYLPPIPCPGLFLKKRLPLNAVWLQKYLHLTQFYPGVYVVVITFLTYPVSTCTAEHSFSSMKKLKIALRSTGGRLSSLAILHIHKHKDVVIDDVITDFARLKDGILALCL